MGSFKKPIKEYPWYIRVIFWAQKKKYGEPLEPAWAWGRSPKLLLGLQVFYRCLDRKSNPISPVTRGLISNLISQLNHCSFCSDISADLLLKNGFSKDFITKIDQFERNSMLPEKDKAALRLAKLITISKEPLKPEELNQVRSFYSETEIVDLVAWISFQNMSSKFNAALDIPAQGFCSIENKSSETQQL